MEGQRENNEHRCHNSDDRKFLPTLNSIGSQVLDEGHREKACMQRHFEGHEVF